MCVLSSLCVCLWACCVKVLFKDKTLIPVWRQKGWGWKSSYLLSLLTFYFSANKYSHFSLRMMCCTSSKFYWTCETACMHVTLPLDSVTWQHPCFGAVQRPPHPHWLVCAKMMSCTKPLIPRLINKTVIKARNQRFELTCFSKMFHIIWSYSWFTDCWLQQHCWKPVVRLYTHSM